MLKDGQAVNNVYLSVMCSFYVLDKGRTKTEGIWTFIKKQEN
jgi:hypothetical protein